MGNIPLIFSSERPDPSVSTATVELVAPFAAPHVKLGNISTTVTGAALGRSLPSRQIHLDFHTSPHIRDVAVEFDPDEFARTFQNARVKSVTVFAKCHHGHLYFITDRAERHPGLPPQLDLLREQVEALHSVGIRAPIYISVQCDELAADKHPDWVARDENGSPVRLGREPGWQILDMNSPYQSYLIEQTRLVLAQFHPVDGIFFDMCWDQPSTGVFAAEAMRRSGLDPSNAEHRARHAHRGAIDYMRVLHALVKEASPEASIYFNSRPLHNLAEEGQFLEQIEIESLPTGGWGYMYFPMQVRFARNFGIPYMGMTARFHKSWGDFGSLKPEAALRYETAQAIAHGARCSIGDQLHPRGRLEPAVYQRIGRVYQHIERCEPWTEGAIPLAQIGVLQTREKGHGKLEATTDEGVTRMLTQLRHQFDFVGPNLDFSRFELIVIPDSIRLDEEPASKLRAFLRAGGGVLATGTSGLSDDGTRVVLDEFGITTAGMSPFKTVYMRFGKRIDRDVPPMEHVIYEPVVRVAPAVGAISLATIVEPYFDRAPGHFCSHAQTPSDRPTKFSAAVSRDRTAYVAFPVFDGFARHGYAPYRQLVGNILGLLLPQPLLRVDGPTGLESTVTRQHGRTIVHLLYFPAERRAPEMDLIEDVVPLRDLSVSLRLDSAPKRVYVAPEMTPLEFEFADGRALARLRELRGHAMIVFE